MQLQFHFVPLEHKLNWNNAFLWTSSHWVLCAESPFPSPQSSVIQVETLHVRVELQTFWVRNDGRDEFDRPPAERVWSAIDVSYHCCQLKHWHQPQQKATVTLQCLMGCEWDPHTVTWWLQFYMLYQTALWCYHWQDEIWWGDGRSDIYSLTHFCQFGSSYRHIEHFSLSRSADKVIFCCPSFFVVSFYLCVLKGRQLHSFLLLNTHTHRGTHSCCNDLTVSMSLLFYRCPSQF